MVFHKKCGLETTDAFGVDLRRPGISYLKRCFGLDRCHWRGWEPRRTYTAVFAHNLLRLVRLLTSLTAMGAASFI